MGMRNVRLPVGVIGGGFSCHYRSNPIVSRSSVYEGGHPDGIRYDATPSLELDWGRRFDDVMLFVILVNV